VLALQRKLAEATEAAAQGEAQKRAIGKARAEIDRLKKEQLVRKDAGIAELSEQLNNLKVKPLDG
jgi:predicted RNase H-like nuclease (RuvC/YqgF family)